jgi:transposase
MAPAYLGIDIAKAKFNVCLLQANGKLKHKVFLNSSAGCQQLSIWLQAHEQSQVHACREATGSYGEALARSLHEQGPGRQSDQPRGYQSLCR